MKKNIDMGEEKLSALEMYLAQKNTTFCSSFVKKFMESPFLKQKNPPFQTDFLDSIWFFIMHHA